MPVLFAMFCLGAFSLFAQVIFTREMLVVFFGNELSIGGILGAWLIGIGIGAFSARSVVRKLKGPGTAVRILVAALVLLAAFLPAQVAAIRMARSFLGVPVGEYAPLGGVLLVALFVFLPTCFTVGLFFPVACHVLANASPPEGDAVSRIYAVEAAGSMVSGIAVTFLILPLMTPVQIVCLAVVIPLVAAAALIRCKPWRVALAVLAMALAAAAFCRPVTRRAEELVDRARWQSSGILPRAGSPSEGRTRILASVDSIYQNLVLLETDEQRVLYSNGQVLFIFPDPIGYEHNVHFIMAQNPKAKSVLLIGGNPVGDVPELLKYPIEELVCVELDPAIGGILRRFSADEYRKVSSRAQFVVMDGVRFVRQCRRQFDVILIDVPDPSTASANRFYTREFYGDVARILAPGGFVHTSLGVSERLQTEAATLGTSVYQTLRDVFPLVLVTYGDRAELFAALDAHAGLTFDREELARRSRGVGLTTEYFRPEFFLGTDKIEPDKVAHTERRFSIEGVARNTVLRPAAYSHKLVLWSLVSGSRVAPVLKALGRLKLWYVVLAVTGAGCLCLVVGAALGKYGSDRGQAVWSRSMIGTAIGTTGFCGMALEIILIFVFQSLYGYVYARIGLVVAMFMLGLVAGAGIGRRMARARSALSFRYLLGLEAALLVFPAGVRAVVILASGPLFSSCADIALECSIYASVIVVGLVVGAEFPLGNRLFCEAGGTVGSAAAVTDASDHLGAAAGSCLAGVLLIPVLGIGAACVTLAAVKAASILCLVSARVVRAKAGAPADR